MADDPKHYPITLPPRQAWQPFDETARAAFITKIAEGAPSVAEACRLIGVSYATANNWLNRGKREDYGDDYEYRLFFLQYQQARAARKTLVDMTLVKAAPLDWRAADALGKRIERQEERETMGPLIIAKAKADVVRAEAEARIAQVKAELLGAGLKRIGGRLYWPAEIAARMNADERLALEALMVREGLLPAPMEEVETVLLERDTSQDEHLNQLAVRWGLAEERSRALDIEIEAEEAEAPKPTSVHVVTPEDAQ